MEGKTGEIKPLGGFFNLDGTQRTKEQLKAEEKASKSPISATDNAIQTEFSNPAQLALRQVRQQTLQDINSAVSATKEAGQDIANAKDVVKEQQFILKQIKEKTGKAPQEEIDALKTKYAETEKARIEIAGAISQNNQDRAEAGSQAIQIGNKTFATFPPEQVEFKAGASIDLSSLDKIDTAIQANQETLNSLSVQASANREMQASVVAAGKDALSEVKNISAGIKQIETDSEAPTIAQQTKQAILAAGATAVDAFNPKAINQQVITSLLG